MVPFQHDIVTPFERELIEMRQLYFATEKQFLEFNEIVPYQYHNDWNQVVSPRLVNLMLSIGPQIEKMLKILIHKMKSDVKKKHPKFYDCLEVLDNQKMLTEQTVGLPNPGYTNILFNPYNKNEKNMLSWWYGYNQIKHELPGGIIHGTLHNTIYSLAALSLLHHIAYIILGWNSEDYSTILDFRYWHHNEEEGVRSQVKNEELLPNELPVLWSSKLFFFPTNRYQFV